jgi:hypothetical protein
MKIPEVIQSNSGAATAETASVLEPMRRLMEESGPVRRTVSVDVICGTRKGIPGFSRKACSRCEKAYVIVKEAVREIGAENAVRARKRISWTAWLLPQSRSRGTHPILEINGIVYTKGELPDKKQLKSYLRSLLVI